MINEAHASGARYRPACKVTGISYTTFLNWSEPGGLVDQRKGPKVVSNKLSDAERETIISVCSLEAYRDLRPDVIANIILDEGQYIGSPRTISRVLAAEKLNAKRNKSKSSTPRAVPRLCAEGPNQVWSWDITYLKTHVKGIYFYLYLILDIYSRKIVGWSVHDSQLATLASCVVIDAKKSEGLSEDYKLILHTDNGAPMKGAVMLETLRSLHITPSNSRPRVSNDNPYSESLFSHIKGFPTYPKVGFETIEEARDWVSLFSEWYNDEHHHSRLNYVTPSERHQMLDEEILNKRKAVIEEAKEKHPERWIQSQVRNMEIATKVYVNKRAEATG